MKAIGKIRSLPGKVSHRMVVALLLACMLVTFAVPAWSGEGYSLLSGGDVTGHAAAIEDVDLLLVGASAFGEARKVMNATDKDAKDNFVNNTTKIVGSKWQNIGIIVGARDGLSGSTWSAYQSPITLSKTEVDTYNNGAFTTAYNKYKAFGFAVQDLNNSAQKSNTSAVSLNNGLDAMSTAAIKLGGFGVKFLNDYNPGPVLLSLYDSRNLSTYASNKLVKIVVGNNVLKNIVKALGDQVPGTNFSLFIIINMVTAIFGFALSMFLVLLGNRTIGDSMRRLIVRIAVGALGIYVISWVLTNGLDLVTNTITTVADTPEETYVKNNLNLYDWYLCGFELPSGINLKIDSSGRFDFGETEVEEINKYTYNRIVGGGYTAKKAQERMEVRSKNGNVGFASFITPSYTSAGGDDGGEAWATDVYYAIMDNYAQNKDDLLDDGGNSESPLASVNHSASVTSQSRYLWMSNLYLDSDGDGWKAHSTGNSSYYGLNPISAFNLVRSDFSGDAVSSTSTVYPPLAYVAFDVTNNFSTDGSGSHMNSITRFIASFTLVMAALKAMITIFTAGFGGLIAGGAKTATGSSHGLGQALGAVFALIGGIVGISVIMSMTLSMLDTVYGIAKDLLVGGAFTSTEVVQSFLSPIEDAVGGIPVLGTLVMGACNGIVNMILTLILSLTFPKLGGIPITVFAQYMADIPGRFAEKAQMIEGMLMSGRMGGGGGGLPPSRGGGQYGKMASAMAGQSFAGGAKQAGLVMASGVAAAKALTGASLSAAGRALNEKGDAIEGKPENPGVDNWDDLSPEEQAAVAEAAQNIEGWDDMDEDARQQALRDAGAYDGNGADPNADPNTDPANNRIEDDPTQEVSESSMNEPIQTEETTGPVPATDGNIGEQPVQNIPESPESINGNMPQETADGQQPSSDRTDGQTGGGTNANAGNAGTTGQESNNNGQPGNIMGTDAAEKQIANAEGRESISGNADSQTGKGQDTGSGTDTGTTGHVETTDAGTAGQGGNGETLTADGTPDTNQRIEGGEPAETGVTGQISEESLNNPANMAQPDTGKAPADTQAPDGDASITDMATDTVDPVNGNIGGNGPAVPEADSNNPAGGSIGGDGNNQTVEQGDNIVKQGDNLQSEQQIEVKANAENNIDAASFDNSTLNSTEELKESNLSNFDNTSSDSHYGREEVTNMPQAQSSLGSAGNSTQAPAAPAGKQGTGSNAPATDGGLPQGTGSSEHHSGGSGSGFATGGYHGVSNVYGGKNEFKANAQNSQQFNVGGSTTNQSLTETGKDSGKEGKPAGVSGTGSLNPSNPLKDPGTKGGMNSQGMNGTARSRWNKEMTIKEQKTARFMHAVGDALQFAGGNKTMGQGVKEAMGHAKDAAAAYVTPIELSDTGAHPFVGTIRNRREADKKKKAEQLKKSGGQK